jgi:hypothetical protein
MPGRIIPTSAIPARSASWSFRQTTAAYFYPAASTASIRSAFRDGFKITPPAPTAGTTSGSASFDLPTLMHYYKNCMDIIGNHPKRIIDLVLRKRESLPSMLFHLEGEDISIPAFYLKGRVLP